MKLPAPEGTRHTAPAAGSALARAGEPTQRLSDLTAQLEVHAHQRRALDAERLSLVAEIVAWSRQAAEGSRRELDYRAARAELAAMLRVSEYRAEREMCLAFDLFQQYPATAAALASGELDEQHVRVVVEAGYVVGAGSDDDVCARRSSYEAAVLEAAKQETPNRLQPIARRIAEHWATTPIEERHRAAARTRRVTVVAHDDGMADLTAYIPAVDAYAIKERLTDIARAIERAGEPAEHAGSAGHGGSANPPTQTGQSAHPSRPDSAPTSNTAAELAPRSRDEIRADAFRDLLLRGSDVAGTAATRGNPDADTAAEGTQRAGTQRAGTQRAGSPTVRAHVELVIPVSAMDPASTNAQSVCELRGYGPISPESAREAAATAHSWNRVFVDRDTGGVITVERYRPSGEMRRYLATRDEHCRFPGCRVPARRCDIDHTVDAALGGPTATDNLAHLCRGHHTLKHHSDWRVDQDQSGVLTWTSPTGRSYADRPREYLPGQRSRVRFRETSETPF